MIQVVITGVMALIESVRLKESQLISLCMPMLFRKEGEGFELASARASVRITDPESIVVVGQVADGCHLRSSNTNYMN